MGNAGIWVKGAAAGGWPTGHVTETHQPCMVPTTFSSEQVRLPRTGCGMKRPLTPRCGCESWRRRPQILDCRTCICTWNSDSAEMRRGGKSKQLIARFLSSPLCSLAHAGLLTWLPSVLLSTQTYCSSKVFGSSALSGLGAIFSANATASIFEPSPLCTIQP